LANREQLIEEEHARELLDTLTVIMDVVQMADNVVAMQAEMSKEELVQEMTGLVVMVALPLLIRLLGSTGGTCIVDSKVDSD